MNPSLFEKEKVIHRSEFVVAADILSSLYEHGEMKISQISRMANLSHYVAVERLAKLQDAGLVTQTRKVTPGCNLRIFSLTEKGRLVNNEFMRFKTFVHEMNLQIKDIIKNRQG